MNSKNFSLLLYGVDKNFKEVSDNCLDDCGMTYLLDQVFTDKRKRKYAGLRMKEMVFDKETIRYRQEIFNDLFNNEKLRENISNALDKLVSLDAVQKNHVCVEKKSSLLELIEKLNELYLYLDVILTLNDGLSDVEFKSRGFKEIYNTVSDICKDKGFCEMKADIYEIMNQVSLYKSITLGLNLDSMLNVSEVMVLSVNTYKHKKKLPLLQRFGRLAQESAVFGHGANAEGMFKMLRKPKEEEYDPIMKNLQYICQDEFDDLSKRLLKMLKKYVDVNASAFTNLIPELEYYMGFVNFFLNVKKWGHPVCIPDIEESDELNLKITDCYNIKLLMSNKDELGKCNIVYNDIDFNKNSNIFILTGPNSGGKTTYTQAVGCSIMLAQQGMAVFAGSYKGITFDNIYTHFPASEEDTVNFGRLGEEAARIHTIMQNVTDRSLFLLNETYSSTSFSEGLFLAKDLLKALKYKRVATIYNTHMHELAGCIEEMNEFDGRGVIDSLVMGVTEDGKRSYKVYVKKPDGNSYARDIAVKYGVTYEMLISKQQ